jgi:hypothetical protein
MKTLLNILLIISLLIISSCGSVRKAASDPYEGPSPKYNGRYTDEYGYYEEDGDGVPDVEDEIVYFGDVEYDVEELVSSGIDEEVYVEPALLMALLPDKSYNKGTLLFNIDSIFVVDVVNRVEAKIVKKEIDEIPQYVIEMFHVSDNGEIKKEEIPVGNIMGMKLTSLDESAFEINSLSSDNQILDENTIAEWVWGVKPIKPGIHSLILIAVIKEDIGEKETVVFDMEIPVLNKPKKDFIYKITTPEYFKKNEKGLIDIIIESSDNSGSFKWGGNGEVRLIIENELNFEITNEGDVNINDNKNYYNFKWTIKPIGKSKELKYHIMIIGDDEQTIISEGVIEVKRNFASSFNNFIDNALKRWYWLFTTLIIPIYFWIRKKFKKKENN